MRLYNSTDVITPQFSQEQFKDYYQTASVISTEALSDYFFKLKDSLSTLKARVIDFNGDRIITDTLSTRYEASHVIKRLKYIDIKDHNVIKPENFKGKYIDYIKDLELISTQIIIDTDKSLSNLKLSISSFINEYTEDKIHTLYGKQYYKETQKITEGATKSIAKYFPSKDNSTKAPIGSLLKSFNDVPDIYTSIVTIEKIVNEETIKGIERLASQASDLVDVLLEQNKTSSVLLRNNDIKKDLVNALYICAKEVEFVSYLYSNLIFFYSSFKALADKLLEEAKETA